MRRWFPSLLVLSCLLGASSDVSAAPFVYQLDDGTSEGSLTYRPGNDVMALNLFTAVPGFESIASLSFFWSPAAVVGTQVTLGLFDDPNDDGQLPDSVLLSSVNTVLTVADLGHFVTYAIPTTTVVGQFFVAMYVENGPGGAILGLDLTAPGAGRSRGIQGDFSFALAPQLARTLGGGIDAMIRANTVDPTASPVPEPATLTLLGLGLAGLAGCRRRRH